MEWASGHDLFGCFYFFFFSFFYFQVGHTLLRTRSNFIYSFCHFSVLFMHSLEAQFCTLHYTQTISLVLVLDSLCSRTTNNLWFVVFVGFYPKMCLFLYSNFLSLSLSFSLNCFRPFFLSIVRLFALSSFRLLCWIHIYVMHWKSATLNLLITNFRKSHYLDSTIILLVRTRLSRTFIMECSSFVDAPNCTMNTLFCIANQ